LNAEIEHASPYGKNPGEKVPGQKKKIGTAAARAYKERLESRHSTAPMPAGLPQPVAVFQASPSSSDRKLGIAVGLPLLATRLWNRLRRGREQGA
jgi:membrane protein